MDCKKKDPTNESKTAATENNSTKIRAFINAAKRAMQKDKDGFKVSVRTELNINANNWGQELAALGTEIKRSVFKNKVMLGDQRPIFNIYGANAPDGEGNIMNPDGLPLMNVYFGNSETPLAANDELNGWTYNASDNSIIIGPNVAEVQAGDEIPKIRIQYYQLDEQGIDTRVYQGIGDGKQVSAN